MSESGWLNYARGLVEDALVACEGWSDIVLGLQAEGIEADVIAEVLREHSAWTAEAREWKAHGYPYDEVAMHLREEVAAEWEDVAKALMEVGLLPADMLRVMLPLLEKDEVPPVVRAALLEGPENESEYETWEVISYYCPGLDRPSIQAMAGGGQA